MKHGDELWVVVSVTAPTELFLSSWYLDPADDSYSFEIAKPDQVV